MRVQQEQWQQQHTDLTTTAMAFNNSWEIGEDKDVKMVVGTSNSKICLMEVNLPEGEEMSNSSILTFVKH